MKHGGSFLALLVAGYAMTISIGTASATTFTSSNGGTPEIVAVSNNLKLDGSFVTLECVHSELLGVTTGHGAAVTVVVDVTDFSFTGCNYEFTLNTAGTLEIHGASLTGNGVITSKGLSITIDTSVGPCTLTTNGEIGTRLGELTDSSSTKGNAILDLNSAKLPRTGGSFLCGSSSTWTGNYTFIEPAELSIH